MRAVASFSHISVCIAGAMTTGARVARRSAESTSSARPRAYLAMASAVAGATTTRSAERPREVWAISGGAGSGNRSVTTGCPVSVEKVIGPTKRVAARVMTTRTSAPAWVRRRASSTTL